jgi:DNA-binding MarR family transcriptional regulator
VEQWRREFPTLDVTAKEVTGRITRLARLFDAALDEAFKSFGLHPGDYWVLAALRRVGPPFALTPTELARHRMMTSGGMTVAIDRLERRGLVQREPNPDDRRGSLVRLTDEGQELSSDAMARHIEVEQELVAGLDAEESDQLAQLLHRLLLHVDR